jgi:hypothetical protein
MSSISSLKSTSRRQFLHATATLAAAQVLIDSSSTTRLMAEFTVKPLLAYVGTFSSPLKDVLPTQVDLPPGNGRGIHLFHVNRKRAP